MANLTFVGRVEANQGQDFSPIPAGDYIAQIIDSNMKATSSNNGQYLELTHEILDGPCAGRKVWARLNLDNPNTQTVQIAMQQLAQITYAVGLSVAPSDSVQLHNRPMAIRVEHYQAGTSDKRGRVREKDSNDIKAWKRIEQAAQGQQVPSALPTQAAQQAAPAQSAVPPWKRNAA